MILLICVEGLTLLLQMDLVVCWWRPVDLHNLCPEHHPISERGGAADWLQFSWKSMCSGTVTQGRHMTLAQRPWWCCTWSYQLFLRWLLRQRRIAFCSCLQPLSAHLLARLNVALVTVTHCTSQAKAPVAHLCASMKSLFVHGANALAACSGTGLTCCVFSVFIQLLPFACLRRTEIIYNLMFNIIPLLK